MVDVLTVAAILAHPDNGQVEVLVPTDASWTRVEVEAREADLPEAGGGALAILTEAAPRTTWQVEAMLRRVHDRGYTGLALPWPERPRTTTRRVAERLGLGVLATGRPTALARACWQLLESRDALTLAYVRRVVLSIEYYADELRDLIGHLATSLGHTVSVVDRHGLLVCVGEPPAPSVLEQIDFGARWVHIVSTPQGDAASVQLHSPTRSGLRLVVSGSGLSDAQLRALATAAEVAMPAVTARLLVDEVNAVSDVSRSSSLLGELLDRRGVADGPLENRLAERGWRTAGWHLGFRCVGRARIDPLELARRITERLGPLSVDAHATVLRNGVSGWLSFRDRPSPGELESWVRRLRTINEELQAEAPVAMGVGSLGAEGAGLAATLGEAVNAVGLAQHRESTGWFMHVDRLGLAQLLGAWTENQTFVPAARSLFEMLDEAEITTLACYLDNESSLSATARALGLHRNTVGPRIRRIQRLLGLDLDDPDVRLALHLACRVVQTPADRGR